MIENEVKVTSSKHNYQNLVIKEDEIVDRNGICGENLTHYFTAQSRTLRINGTGVMDAYDDPFYYPWNKYKEYIEILIIEEGLTQIPQYAFFYSTNITTVSLPETLTYIGNCSFQQCISIKTISIPSNVAYIGKSAFEFCENITMINIPSSVTFIGNQSFSSCLSLQSINVDENNKQYMSLDGILFSKNQQNLIIYPAGRTNPSYHIYNAKNIYAYAFAHCHYLLTVHLHSVISIGECAFNECQNLSSISMMQTANIEDKAFYFCEKLSNLTYADYDPPKVGKLSFWFTKIKIAYVNARYTSNKFDESIYVEKCIRKGSTGKTSAYIYNNVTGSFTIYGTGNMANYSKGYYFPSYYFIEKITIDDQITSIGDSLCYGLYNLTYINIPQNVTYIGKYAFFNCSKLVSIEIPDCVSFIGEYAFSNCTELNTINFPKSLISIENGLFHFCDHLTNVKIGENVQSIAAGSFSFCYNLREIEINENNAYYKVLNDVIYSFDDTILSVFAPGNTETSFIVPNTIKYIDEYAFANSKLDSVEVGNNVLSVNKYAFYNSSISSIVLPEQLTSIEAGTFSYCSNLNSINIPNEVTKIGDESFLSCGLKSIAIPDKVISIENFSFHNCQLLETIKLSKTLENIGDNAFSLCSIISLIIPDSVISIGKSSFQNCTQLESLDLGQKIQTIGDYSFQSCNISSLNIPNSVISIGNSSFSNCQHLISIEFGNGLKEIEDNAFVSCNISSLKLPNNIISIGDSSFKNCQHLSIIEFSQNLESIGNYAFSSCNMSTVNLPDSVLVIGNYSFEKCKQLKSINFGQQLLKIGQYAFDSSNIESIEISKKVTYIDVGTFQNCRYLKNIILHENLVSIQQSAFQKSGIESLEIPDGLERIEYNAFYDSYLTYIYIPDNVKYIGKLAFGGCKQLISVDIGNGISNISYLLFASCAKLISVTFGSNVSVLDDNIFDGCKSLQYINYIGTKEPTYTSKTFANCNSARVQVPLNYKNSQFGTFRIDKKLEFGDCVNGTKWILNQKGHLLIYGNGKMDNYNSVSMPPWNVNKSFITNITIQKGIQSIGNEAFIQCTNLELINISDTLSSIGEKSFKSCNNLKLINISTKNMHFKLIDGIIFSNDETVLLFYPPGKNNTIYRIPKTVTSIGNYAFVTCNNLENLEYIKNEEPIYVENSFYECDLLKEIHVLNDYKGETFAKMSVLKCVYIGECGNNLTWILNLNLNSLSIFGSGEMYNYSTSNEVPWDSLKLYINTVVLPASITSIGDFAFYNCTNLQNINMNDQILYIGNFSFSRCISMEFMVIPDYAYIGYGTFSYCSGLKAFNVTSKNIIYKVIDGTLYKNNGMKLLYYPSNRNEYYILLQDSVYSFDDYAFSGVNKSFKIIFNKNMISIGKYAFAESSIYSINLSQTISINDYAFSKCFKLNEVILSQNVVSIGNHAFSESNISKINIINISHIGDYAFYKCVQLTTCKFGQKLLCIGDHAFEETGLSSINIVFPLNNMTIGSFSFANCQNLVSVHIDSIDSIDNYAFYNCNALSSFLYNGTSDPTIGTNLFDGCLQLKAISVPLTYENETFGNFAVDKYFAYGICNQGVLWNFDNHTGTLTIHGRGNMKNYSPADLPPWNLYKLFITQVKFNVNINTVGSSAFKDCINLKSVSFSSTISQIRDFCFIGCINLKYVYISDEVSIGIGVFAYSGLETLELNHQTNYKFVIIDSALYTNSEKTLVFYPPGKNTTSFEIPKIVTKIQDYAFAGCHSLISIDVKTPIPGLTYIGNYSFSNCSNLTTFIYRAAQRPHEYAKNVFEGCINLNPIYVPLKFPVQTFCTIPVNKTFEEGTYGYLQYNFNLINGSLKFTGSGAMGSTTQSWHVFKNNIRNAYIENGITNIYDDTFLDHINLEYVDIPISVKSIGMDAFKGCIKMESIYISKNISKIEPGAFSYCTSLHTIDVDYKNSLFRTINGILLKRNTIICYPAGLQNSSYVVPGDFSEIESKSFAGCINLISIETTKMVWAIGESAFSDCTNLRSVKLYFVNGKIGTNAFSNCINLNSFIYNHDKCPSYTEYVFTGCDQLGKIWVYKFYQCETFCEKEIYRFSDDDFKSPTEIINYASSIQDETSNDISSSSENVIFDSSENIENHESSNKDDISDTSNEYGNSEFSSKNNIVETSNKEEFPETSSKIEDTELSSNLKDTISSEYLTSLYIHESTREITKSESTHNEYTETLKPELTSKETSDEITSVAPLLTEVIAVINISDNLNEEEINQKLNEQFEQMKEYGNNTSKVVIFNSSLISFNSNLEDNQYIKPSSKDSKIIYKGGNLNLVLPDSDKVTVEISNEQANISLKGEGDLYITQSNYKSKSINFTKNSQINGTVKLTVPDEIDSLTFDLIRFEKNSSFITKTESNEQVPNVNVKNIETTYNSNATITNANILNSIKMIQSSTLNLDNVTLDNAVINLNVNDFKVKNDEWIPFFKGNFNNPPSKIIINNENENINSPEINEDYVIASGLFEENKCSNWLEKIEFGNSGFNTKNCLSNDQLLNFEDQRIIIKNQNNNKKSKSNAGKIAGITIGCFAGVAIIAIAVIFIIKHKRNEKSSNQDSFESDNFEL